MTFTIDTQYPIRSFILLRGFDYATPGAYFVTIVVRDRACLLGSSVDETTVPNEAGRKIADAWHALPTRFERLRTDAFVVMPNHVHGILVIDAAHIAARPQPPLADPRIPAIIGAFKSITTVDYVNGVKAGRWPASGVSLWQRNYFEHIIRNEKALRLIREYIANNPSRWAEDEENPTKP